MKTESFLPLYPIQPQAEPCVSLSSAKTPQELLKLLIEESKRRGNTHLTSELGEALGLYTGYDRTSHPQLADETVRKLGQIIAELLQQSLPLSTPADPLSPFSEKDKPKLICFLQQQNQCFQRKDRRIHSVADFIARFDRYLELTGKSEQTRKIYRGKAKEIFRLHVNELPLSLYALKDLLLTLRGASAEEPKKDHNLQSTISKLLIFLDELLRDDLQ